MERKKQSVIPVQYIPVTQCEEDEIDLKELIKTILKYKKFIFVFTLLITFLSAVYVFLKTPVYEINTDIQVGYISNKKIYLIDPQAVKLYIKNNFDNSNNDKIKYPKVEVNLTKGTRNILNLKIDTFSNKEGLDYLNKILSAIHKKEDKKLNIYIKNIKSQIKILQNHSNNLKNKIKILEKQLKITKDPDIYKIILNSIFQNQKEIVSTQLKITNLQNQISPVNITKTQIIGKIIQHDHPIKPKKKLIITVAFITGLILSIFLVFFIEFIKSFKEENPTT
jgi:uncharacterized protein involved in exopolysaccharide biosynthesis